MVLDSPAVEQCPDCLHSLHVGECLKVVEVNDGYGDYFETCGCCTSMGNVMTHAEDNDED